MLFLVKFILKVKVLLILVQSLSARNYRFIPANLDLFTPCSNQPSNVLSATEFFDLSLMKFEYLDIDNTLKISGNATSTWNIEKEDRIQVRLELIKFDRGLWVPTGIAVMHPDACKAFFAKNQYWYSCWSKYIVNDKEVKDKCLNVPGTTFVHKPFIANMTGNFPGYYNGRHKIVAKLKAFGPLIMERNTSVCIEILGDIEPLN